MRALILAVALAFAAAPALADPLKVTGLDGKTVEVSAADFADLPRATAALPVGHGGQTAAYEGATLTSLLRMAGAPAGPSLHGRPVAYYVTVTGADGFTVVLSLAETDKAFHKGAVIVADNKAGAALGEKEGPYRLVVDGDLVSSRAVRNVVSIALKKIDGPFGGVQMSR